MSQPIVTVYSAGPSCMACRQTKRHLDKRGITYTEHGIDEFVSTAAQYLGLSTAPIVCVSLPVSAGERREEFWDGYRPDRLDAIAVGADL